MQGGGLAQGGALTRCSHAGTLFTPLRQNNTDTQSFNVQLRKQLDTAVNVVHARSIPGVTTRHSDLDIIVIRCAAPCALQSAPCAPLGLRYVTGHSALRSPVTVSHQAGQGGYADVPVAPRHL